MISILLAFLLLSLPTKTQDIFEAIKIKFDAIEADHTIKELAYNTMKTCTIPDYQNVIVLQRINGDNSYSTINPQNPQQRYMILGLRGKTLNEIHADAYHEAGHLYYKDSENNITLHKKLNAFLYAGISSSIIAFLTTFKYTSRFNKILTAHVAALGLMNSLLIPVFLRGKTGKFHELRADEFGFKHMIQDNRIDLIMDDIVTHLDEFERSGGKIKKSTFADTYPTPYERAEQAIKFLKNNGIDPKKPLENVHKDADKGLLNYCHTKINEHFSL